MYRYIQREYDRECYLILYNLLNLVNNMKIFCVFVTLVIRCNVCLSPGVRSEFYP